MRTNWSRPSRECVAPALGFVTEGALTCGDCGQVASARRQQRGHHVGQIVGTVAERGRSRSWPAPCAPTSPNSSVSATSGHAPERSTVRTRGAVRPGCGDGSAARRVRWRSARSSTPRPGRAGRRAASPAGRTGRPLVTAPNPRRRRTAAPRATGPGRPRRRSRPATGNRRTPRRVARRALSAIRRVVMSAHATLAQHLHGDLQHAPHHLVVVAVPVAIGAEIARFGRDGSGGDSAIPFVRLRVHVSEPNRGRAPHPACRVAPRGPTASAPGLRRRRRGRRGRSRSRTGTRRRRRPTRR